MITPAGPDAQTAAPPPKPPADLPRWPDTLISASTVGAWACLALIVVGLAFGTVPVRNPKVQDCGAPLAFVLTGRVDAFLDPNSPPKGVTAKQAEAANKHPCRKRVAPRMVHSAEFLLGGLVVGLTGVALLVIGRSARRRAAVRAASPAAAPSGAWEPPPIVQPSVPGGDSP